MAAPNITPYTNKIKLGRGRLAFNALVNGIYEGYRPLGDSPGFEINVEGDEFTLNGSESGISETIFSTPLSVTRSATITCNNVDRANVGLFIAGEEVTIQQSATPVTDEVIPSVNAGRFYQLGATAINPSGVRGVSAVVVRMKQGADAAARANSTAYVVGDFVVPASANDHFYLCTVAGTSAGSPPSFTTDGTTYTDGTATFIDMGLIVVPSTADVNYRVDAGLGLLSPTEAGTIAVANTRYSAAVAGARVSLEVDYTPAANTREQVRSGGTVSVQGQLKFIADNPTGENDDVFLPSVTITPNGALAFITGDSQAQVEFSVGIGILNSQTAAIYVDGRPVGL
jgi:hypothetical protein